MKEDFLHYLWKQQLYANQSLITTQGEAVKVVSSGTHNTNSGPDFLNAKIKIGQTTWAGNVEIHVKAADWYKHNHNADKAYDNVILHVVAEADTEITRANSEKIPTVKLEVNPEIYQQYLYLMNSTHWVACETFITKISDFTIFQWKERLLVERLIEKSKLIEERFQNTNYNWEETFYQTLAYNFGFKVNSAVFEMLAKSLPLNYLAKHKDDIQLLEAFLFGQSGLLPEKATNNYMEQLKKDYKHLQHKFKLKPLHKTLWKFMRMRPGNFPTIRLAQFAQLVHQSTALLSKILEIDKVTDLYQFFDVSTSDYWKTHYTFGKESTAKQKHLGNFATQNLVINSIAPFLFFYGNYHQKERFSERAIHFLQEIPAEKNKITGHWQDLGLSIENAFDSQALIQLKNMYCNHRKCLNCNIGNQVIQHQV